MKNSRADNITMSGGGLYSLATRGAKDVIDIATPRVLDAIGDMDISGDRFALADTGCADAGTSLDMIRRSIEKIQKLKPGIQITVIYADQPANDYNALINIVHGRTQFETWLGQFEQVFPLVSGTSFYRQCVPDHFLDFVFSATAMHWLSAKPCNINDHVHMVGACGEELEAFTRQARQDWETILQHRARELRPGGKMALVNFCRDRQGRYLGNTGGVNMFDTLNAIWREMVDQGRVSGQEYRNMTLPQYYRTVEEFSEPLINRNSACYRAGLRLDSIETGVVPCPFAGQFKVDRNPKKFADGLIPTIRSWNQSIFCAGLDPNRPVEERRQLIEDYYSAYHQRVMAQPQGQGMDYVHAYMTISRV